MNKKFTFMVAALLAAGSSFAATEKLVNTDNVVGATSFKSGAYYYLVFDADGALLDGAEAIGAASGALKSVTYSSGFTTADGETNDNYLWKVESKTDASGNVTYTFYNKAEKKYMALDGGTTLTLLETLGSDDINKFSWTSETNTSGVYIAGKVGLKLADNKYLDATSSTVTAQTDASDSFIYLYGVKETKLESATDLNKTMAGDGFSFDLADGTEVEDENNIFSKPMKAFYINEISSDGGNVPAGMYFATEVPESLDGDNITTIEVFEKCKFVAVSPNLISGTSYGTAGLKLVEVSGADLKRYTQVTDEDETSGEDVWVNNACFTVTEKDKVNNPGKYTLSLEKIRYQADADGNHKQSTEAIYIGLNSDKVVTTVAAASAKEFKCVNSTVVDPLTLVADSKTPTFYNIQFVSGEGKDSENGKYLGVAQAASFGFVAQGESLVNLDAPQYRFVVSQVSENVITFKNIETGTTLATELYETADGYRLSVNGADPKVQIAQSTAEGYASAEALSGKEIKLIEVEADTEAGFLVKAPNNNEPFKFMFAKAENADAADKYYLVEGTSNATSLTNNISEVTPLQFVFEPVEGEDGLLTYKSDYIYTEDGKRRVGDNATMTTAQKYILRVVGDNDEYVKVENDALKVGATKAQATSFIAKVNYDGSVSLIEAEEADGSGDALTLNAGVKTFGVSTFSAPSLPSYDNNTNGKSIYAVPSSSEYKMYMISEDLGLSLEAESKHITLESENGGFVKVAENGDAVIDNLATAATEDLTFWLDTTNSKSVLPTFYISKAGKFLFNAADSIKAWEDANALRATNPYKVADGYAKAIFKAATLVSSDTLKTSVNGKEVSVAAATDQNKGVVGGIKNFQFNIVKADDAEDNYILKSIGKQNYVTSNNNVLTFTSSKDLAMRVVVSGAQAPTSNESVSASEVKVIANNGSIVVKNAAGKNVVVSTILGQVVANEVLTSDNATINVPAGIVVVAVEGESFKVNVK